MTVTRAALAPKKLFKFGHDLIRLHVGLWVFLGVILALAVGEVVDQSCQNRTEAMQVRLVRF